MNQDNNFNPLGGTNNNTTPTPMPSTPSNNNGPVLIPTPSTNVNPTPVQNNTESPLFDTPVQGNNMPQGETVIDTNNIPPVVDTSNLGTSEVTVIDTKKTKTGYFGLVIVVIILIVFVVKIDDVIDLYEKYVENKVPTGTVREDTTNNLVNGFIMVNDNNSYQSINNIRFYNFEKNGSNKITFNYLSTASYSKTSDLDLYVELYSATKELLYRELFDDEGSIERSTVKTYKLTLDKDIYSKTYYALIKKYTDEQKNVASSVKCTYSNTTPSVDNYEITYNFVNKALVGYSVNKQTSPASDSNVSFKELKEEFNKIPTTLNPSFNNGNLNYTIDLQNVDSSFKPLYEKGTIDNMIIIRENEKKWTCNNG